MANTLLNHQCEHTGSGRLHHQLHRGLPFEYNVVKGRGPYQHHSARLHFNRKKIRYRPEKDLKRQQPQQYRTLYRLFNILNTYRRI